MMTMCKGKCGGTWKGGPFLGNVVPMSCTGVMFQLLVLAPNAWSLGLGGPAATQ